MGNFSSRFMEAFAKTSDLKKSGLVARIVPTWQAGRPLPAKHDFEKFAKEGYAGNPLVAACIWEIGTSASEPSVLVQQKQRDGTLAEAKGSAAENLRALIANPNPEQTTYTFLEQIFTFQQLTGNWFFRKLRARAGNVVGLWPLNPSSIKILVSKSGWVTGYEYYGIPQVLPAEDVVHDPLHPDPMDDFWGLAPLVPILRQVDLDNQSAEYLRVFFQNNATPGGLLKLKARMDKVDREVLKELWTKEHTGTSGWHTISVLDADGEYQEIGASPEKLRLQALWDQTESRICMAFGVPPILVGATIGLNRSTFSNYVAARRSFWDETLIPLYKRCAQRLTSGLAREFGDDLVIKFDFSSVEALQEERELKRAFSLNGWDKGLLTLDQALELAGFPRIGGDEGGARKTAAAPAAAPGGFEGLLSIPGGTHHHAQELSPTEKKTQARIRKIMADHFKKQGKALVSHLEG